MNERIIDGEVEHLPAEREQLPAKNEHLPAESAQTAVFNPLDAPQEMFTQHLAKRQDNYNALREHLRNTLVPNKDFGRIHHANKETCPKPWECTYDRNPFHYSDYQLLDPGADKIKDILGLRVTYDDSIGKYQNASLKGIQIQEIILRAFILGPGDVVVCEGAGSCGVKEAKGNLSNAIKKAQKRARVDGIKRLPGVSALFDDDFFESIPDVERPKHTPTPSQADREHGARASHQVPPATVIGFGKHKGQRFDDLRIRPDYLVWMRDKAQQADHRTAAGDELRRRSLQSEAELGEVAQPAAPPQQQDDTDPHAEFISAAFSDIDDNMPPPDAY